MVFHIHSEQHTRLLCRATASGQATVKTEWQRRSVCVVWRCDGMHSVDLLLHDTLRQRHARAWQSVGRDIFRIHVQCKRHGPCMIFQRIDEHSFFVFFKYFRLTTHYWICYHSCFMIFTNMWNPWQQTPSSIKLLFTLTAKLPLNRMCRSCSACICENRSRKRCTLCVVWSYKYDSNIFPSKHLFAYLHSKQHSHALATTQTYTNR